MIEAPDSTRFVLGDWLVDVPAHRLRRGEESIALEPRPMAVLATLCRQPGVVLGPEALLEACWGGEALGDNPVHKVIAGLRRALQDSASDPRYIETIRKQGYRLIAPTHVLSPEGARSHQGAWRGKSPFCGLEPFGPAHASVFFGRDEDVASLRARLARQWQRAHPLVLLLGPSGSGKTSLVQAGLLPSVIGLTSGNAAQFRACTAASLDLGATGDEDLWQALAGTLLDWEVGAVPLLSGHSVETLAAALQERPDEVLALLRTGLVAAQAAAPPLLVLDRLEALFQPHAGDVGPFLEGIARLVGSRVLAVLAVCRNDFYPSVAQHALFMRDKEHGAHMDLAPPGPEAIAQMIRLPARAAGLTYGSDPSGMNRLDDRLCADAMAARDALPLLQYTLQALYLARGPADVLAWEAYDALGGLEGAVGRRAEATLAALPAAEQEALGRLLSRLVVLASEDGAPTSRWVALAELEGAAEHALVHALVEARLLVSDQAGGRPGLRVAHEALLRCWPRVTAWIAQHRAMLVARDELSPWVRRWADSGHANAMLLPRGAMLWKASAALAEEPALFDGAAGEYLRRSLARVRRQNRWRWAASAGVLLLALLAAASALRSAQLARLAAAREQQSQRLASFMLGDLADQLRPLGKLDLLGRVGEQGLTALTLPGAGDESAQDTLQRARALVVIGEVNGSRGKGRVEVATAALHQAWDQLVPLERERTLPRADYYRTLGAAAFWLGQIAFDAGDWAQATAQMDRYRAACERWRAAQPDDPQARIELGYALGSLGSIAIRRAAWAEAERWFKASLALKTESLALQPQEARALDAVASAQTWLGQLALIQGRPRDAMPLLDAAFEVQARMQRTHPDQGVRMFDLGVLSLRRSEALQAQGRWDAAVQAMDDGVARMEQASQQDPRNERWRAEVLHARSGRLLMRATAGLPVGAEPQTLQRMLDGQDARARADSLWRKSAARLAVAEAELAAGAEDWHGALAQARRAGVALEDLLARQPNSWQERELQAALVFIDLRAEAALGAPDPAACGRSADALKPAVDSGQGGRVLEAWFAARRCAGRGATDAADWRRLTAGGYQPVSPGFSQP